MIYIDPNPRILIFLENWLSNMVSMPCLAGGSVFEPHCMFISSTYLPLKKATREGGCWSAWYTLWAQILQA